MHKGNQAAELSDDALAEAAMAWPNTSLKRRVQLPQPGFQSQARLTSLVEHAPASTQLCTSDSDTALQMQMYTVGLAVRWGGSRRG
ncbi:hypothetical protein NRB20_06600 [Nocardia sp. RB20]|uniref:Uncharacterized protein n=1 Tax=Nocardia macrotermitis TaxID=2585198 RepID=A0A7K0CVS3_9NOCA|nr:hypothetical protein [Nocardia macrotermitis]